MVWLVLLLLTPLRVLLALAGDTACRASTEGERRAASALYGLGGSALVVVNALIVWWAREAGLTGISLLPRWVAEGALGLIAAWVAVTTVELWRGAAAEGDRRFPAFRRWAVISLLALGLAAATLWRAPLLDHLAHASHGPAYPLPGALSALRFLATSPALWIALALGLWARWRAEQSRRGSSRRRDGFWRRREPDPARALERGIRQSALALLAGVEAGILHGALVAITKGLVGAARLAQRWIEGVVLEGATRQIAQTATDGGRLAYRWIEGADQQGTTRRIAQTAAEGGLEGLLRRVVRAVLSASRWLQRRHTGRLRRNLVWVAASLVLALLAIIVFVW
jgi:hypothetical protein